MLCSYVQSSLFLPPSSSSSSSPLQQVLSSALTCDCINLPSLLTVPQLQIWHKAWWFVHQSMMWYTKLETEKETYLYHITEALCVCPGVSVCVAISKQITCCRSCGLSLHLHNRSRAHEQRGKLKWQNGGYWVHMHLICTHRLLLCPVFWKSSTKQWQPENSLKRWLLKTMIVLW